MSLFFAIVASTAVGYLLGRHRLRRADAGADGARPSPDGPGRAGDPDAPGDDAGVAGVHPAPPPITVDEGLGPGETDSGLTPRVVQHLYEIAARLDANEANSFADPHDILGLPLFEEGVSLLASPSASVAQVVGYALGTNWVLGVMASEALVRRTDSAPAVDRVLSHIGHGGQWPLFFRLRFLAAHADRPILGTVLRESEAWWAREPVTVMAVDEFIEQRVAKGMPLALSGALDAALPEKLDGIEALVRRLRPEHADPLLAELAAVRERRVDPGFVASAGRLWPSGVDGPKVVPTTSVSTCLAEMRRALEDGAPRSILLVGESGVGKTARRRAFSQELAHAGWRIFETSAAELLAGTRYIGDIESRLSELRANASVAKRVAIYVDRMSDLATAGAGSSNPVSVLDHLWPLIQARELFFVGEAGPAGYQLLERRYAGFAGAFQVIRLLPASEDETSALVAELVSGADPPVQDAVEGGVAAQAIQLARGFLNHRALPGSVLDLVRVAIERTGNVGGPPALGRTQLLGALAQLTGLPEEILDEDARLDLPGLREAFRRRVIGQDEAVDCLVERIAMLKAGLTDPRRPVGVYLFAGPTGTGKTEIARTLAEILFGSPEQMIRLDMSEFQTADTLERLIGQPQEQVGTGGSLVQQIRQQPFSVVLLDEFEKAHPAVWDLFLQVFDDGRLTDRQGTLANFRHAIIVLTSNLGATISSEAGIGFVGKAGQFSSTEVLRVVNRTFRREFVNRLDRVVVFRPLSRDVMRRILDKELQEAFARRGFQRLAWAVEWEDSAIEFLLARGFTPDLGARPLRRAIESHLLAPLSMAIVENRAPQGEQFLFIGSDGTRLDVDFVDPNAGPESDVSEADLDEADGLSVRGLVLQPAGTEAEEAFLLDRVERLSERLADEAWVDAKADGLAQINASGFWDRADRFDVLDRVELMDRIEAATSSLQSLSGRLERSHGSAELVRRVAEKLFVVEQGILDLDERRPTLGFVGVRLLGEDAEHPEGVEYFHRIVGMYRAWASKRRMHWEELLWTPGERLVAVVGGFGGYATLERDTGLHLLEVPSGESRFERVRVRVAAVPHTVSANLPSSERLEIALAELARREEDARNVVRRYRVRPSPLVRDGVYGWRTGRVDAVWNGDFDVWPRAGEGG